MAVVKQCLHVVAKALMQLALLPSGNGFTLPAHLESVFGGARDGCLGPVSGRRVCQLDGGFQWPPGSCHRWPHINSGIHAVLVPRCVLLPSTNALLADLFMRCTGVIITQVRVP